MKSQKPLLYEEDYVDVCSILSICIYIDDLPVAYVGFDSQAHSQWKHTQLDCAFLTQ